MWPNPAYADQTSPGDIAPGSQPIVYAQQADQPSALVPAQAAPVALGSGSDVPAALSERIQLCEYLAEANILPSALRKQPANVLLILFKATALDIPLSVALEHLHVIDGKVGHSAELLRALLYRHGHVLRWTTMTDKEVTGELTLRHDQKHPRTARFTITDATRMELTKKATWQKDPESMMVARCTTRLVSRHCPEIAVALGNLSAMDVDNPDPAPDPVAATAEIDRDSQARQVLADATEASTVEQIKKLGLHAKTEGLLELNVGTAAKPEELQAALLRRMGEIAKVSTDKAAAAATKERP
jgi:hypothetical protein